MSRRKLLPPRTARLLSTISTTIEERNFPINALISSTISSGDSPSQGALAGLSVAVKDNICTKDMPTSCSSRMLQNFQPGYDATVVKNLRDHGAHIMGKTNCDEFGMGSLNIHSVWGPVVNPFERNGPPRSAGGSSGGSAAAVAASLVDVALGTDTGGSTRLPASYCGIVGFKPSYGMLSRWGLVSFADSLDCVGLMAKSVEPVKKTFGQRQLAITERLNSRKDLDGVIIGIPQEYFPVELSTIVLDALQVSNCHSKNLGAKVVPVSLPSTSYALSAYYVLASAEASSNLARYDGVQYGFHADPSPSEPTPSSISELYSHTRSLGFGSEVKRRILLGTYALTADAFDNYFLQAQRTQDVSSSSVFSSQSTLPHNTHVSNNQTVDILLHPSAIQTAPYLHASTSSDDVLTVPASLAGLPALNMPCPIRDGDWPIGFSLVGQWGMDEVLLESGLGR
ncbi:amidase signature domain-containing protein [Flagelloscypha sp. PMI_526]|nr:amidase signature domain-containing protein [Flagelloscypha sp. PMI_526]